MYLDTRNLGLSGRRRKRGMGAVVSAPPGFVGPIQTAPGDTVVYPASQSQIADIWTAIQSMGTSSSGDGYGTPIGPTPGEGTIAGIPATTFLFAGVGLFAGVALIKAMR